MHVYSLDGSAMMVTHLGAAFRTDGRGDRTSIFDHYDCLYVEGYLVQNHDSILVPPRGWRVQG